MPKLGIFPSSAADLNTYFQTATPYIITNKDRLLVSHNNENELTTAFEDWNTSYPASQNGDTRTKSIIQAKDAARDKMLTVLRRIYADVPSSVWTIQDKNTLNITEKSTTRTPAPVPTTKPVAQVDTSKRLEHTVSFSKDDGSHSKPAGVRGCQIWYKIGDPAVDPSELNYMATDTASPYKYTFDGEHAGKLVYYWLRWENTRGETGPWSDVVSATITA